MNDPTPAPPRPASTGVDAGGAADAATPARLKRVSDGAQAPLLPDFCNIGIVVRVLLAANAAAVLHALVQAASPAGAIGRFLSVVAWLEGSVLLTLAALCAVRRSVAGRARTLQWATAVGVPALATALVSLGIHGVGLGSVGHAAPAAGGSAPTEALLWPMLMRALAAAVAGWVLVEYFRLRARAFSPSLSEARLQALQARIRPHFLFNSLNTVLSLMRSRPREAEATLENLADLFRVFMRDTRELVPLDDEIETCRQYLAIEQLRLGHRLKVAWALDTMPGDALLPSLLLQPLIENAVHHGIEPRSDEGEVTIKVERVAERVRVEIVNPLAEASAPRRGNQMALSNVRERLMLLYDMEAELNAAPADGRFRLTLEFPYRKERRRRDVRRHHHPDR